MIEIARLCRHGHLVSTGLVTKPVGRAVLARLPGSLLASRKNFNPDKRLLERVHLSAAAEEQSSRQFYCKVNQCGGPATAAARRRSRLQLKGVTSADQVDLAGHHNARVCVDLTARSQVVLIDWRT